MSLRRTYRGKVRDIYDVDDRQLLMVASDRISAFDVVMAEPVPDKGRVLTGHLRVLARSAGRRRAQPPLIVRSGRPARRRREIAGWPGRVMLVRRAEMLPIECIVRGYLTGLGVEGVPGERHHARHAAARRLRESAQLPEPVFTPSTKADDGPRREHLVRGRRRPRRRRAGRARRATSRWQLYRAGRGAGPRERGIIIADTKFELGLVDGELVVCDEVLTPDSSRFWPVDEWEPGTTPPSFDKQPVRDYLEALDWDKKPPPPPLPDEVVEATGTRYVEAYERITGRSFADWPGVRRE